MTMHTMRVLTITALLCVVCVAMGVGDCPLDGPQSCNDGIIIIGAGIAGLSAATSLKLMGFTNVTVLEASGSVGGRLKSTSFVEKDGGPPLDVGAEWIHARKGGQVLQSIMNFQNDDNLRKYNNPAVVPDLIAYKPTIFLYTRKSRLLTWLYKETKFKSTTWHHWLLSNLYEPVKDCVELNAPVSNIDYSHNHEVVLTLENGTTRTANRVICTAPMQVLKEGVIKFDPPLPTKMRDAFNAIEMPPGFRILFQMSKKFYQDLTYLGSLSDLVSYADDITVIYDPLWGKELPEDLHVIAFVAIGHRSAGEMSKLRDEELAIAALAKIDELYDGQGTTNLVGAPVVQNWRAEPHIRGAYTFP
eukprot:Selendium_serpulae@DN5460_c1_g1_i3.p1